MASVSNNENRGCTKAQDCPFDTIPSLPLQTKAHCDPHYFDVALNATSCNVLRLLVISVLKLIFHIYFNILLK